AGDSEPRDDARWLVLEVSPPPSVVLLAAPPDWDSRFLARTLSDVARVPVRTLVQSGSDGSGWRDAAGLTPVSAADAAQAVAGARLVVRMGDPAALDRFPTKGAVLTWPTQRGQDGDWYVRAPEPSPLAGALAGVAWDSLPPAAAESGPPQDEVVTLTAGGRSRIDTLRFDATGRAELSLPQGVYAYGAPHGAERGVVVVETYSDEWRPAAPLVQAQRGGAPDRLASSRSEEHTSELQSRGHLVCRLLLEKKKSGITAIRAPGKA